MKLILSDGTQIEIIDSAATVSPKWKKDTAKEAAEILDKVLDKNTGTLTFQDEENMVIENTKLVKKFVEPQLNGSCVAGFTWDYKTEGEILEDKAEQVNNAIQELSDDIALKYIDLYKHWENYEEGEELVEGLKVSYHNALYKVKETHKKQSTWMPENSPNQFEAINSGHSGTLEDPIPWIANMQPEKDKYYIENDLIAKCIEDPGQPLYNKLSELVPGRYFEKVN